MVETDKQRGRTRVWPRGAEPESLRPLHEDQAAAAALDLARQEKSLEALGRMLKTKREINGLTRRDMVIKIKIPMDQLESIEDGRLSSLPPVFAKGFLRAYANELGLDAEAILDDYRKMTGGYKNEPANRNVLAAPYAETKISTGGRRPGWGLAAVLLLLGLAALFWAWPNSWLTGAGQRLKGEAGPEVLLAQPDGEPEALAVIPQQEPAAHMEPPEVAVASGSLGEIEDEDLEFVGEGEVQGGELVLVSQRDGVWLQLLADGQLVNHYWLKRGQTVVQRAETVVLVRTGQGTALTASWNGRDLGLLSSQPVAEVRFPASSP